MEPFIGQISLVAFTFAPRGYAACNGQLLSIAQNTALFSLLGTTYGGNGQTTFALPDLRGRAPMAFGNGAGLTPRTLGEQVGVEAVTLTTAQLPMHTHAVSAQGSRADRANAAGAQLAAAADAVYATSAPAAALAPGSVSTTGASLPHNNMQPHLALMFVIALEGIYPSRN